jgi:hypothetical protein
MNLGGQTFAQSAQLDEGDAITVQAPSTSSVSTLARTPPDHSLAEHPLPDHPLPDHPLPDHTTSRRVVDKKFITIMGALGAAESMRLTTKELVLEHEMEAGAPWVSSVPSHSHLVFTYTPIFLAEMAVAYEIKKPHSWLPGDRTIRKLWWLYPAASGSLHLRNAIANIRTQPGSACPPEYAAECQQ